MKRMAMVMFLALSWLGAQGFTLSSPGISGQLANEQVFNGFGCSGKNVSPALAWENAPKGTKSFAITMYDKDAPTGSGWWHWVVFNIPSKLNHIGKNSGDPKTNLWPKSVTQSITDFGVYGYGGACPPKGDRAHQYLFTIYALDIDRLDLPKDASPANVGFMVNAHTIEKASVVAYYQR